MVKLDKTHSRGWSKGGEVYPQAPPPFIGGWSNNTGTMGAGFHRRKTKRTQRKSTLAGKNLTIQRSSSSER